MGAWIEIYVDLDAAKDGYGVAPLVGAWIEIDHKGYYCSTCAVAPLVGAWIEIDLQESDFCIEIVAPLVGAWIEIHNK